MAAIAATFVGGLVVSQETFVRLNRIAAGLPGDVAPLPSLGFDAVAREMQPHFEARAYAFGKRGAIK